MCMALQCSTKNSLVGKKKKSAKTLIVTLLYYCLYHCTMKQNGFLSVTSFELRLRQVFTWSAASATRKETMELKCVEDCMK